MSKLLWSSQCVLVVIEGGLLRIVQKNVDTDVAYMDP